MIRDVIHKLALRQDLTKHESYETMNIIMSGNASEAQIAAFLMGLRMKGETVEEIAGCAKSMREKAVAIRTRRDSVIDTCGTGGDGSGTFNISTCAAIIASAAGASVAKHGNRAVSSQAGSADVLRELGVSLDNSPERTTEILDEVGIAFLFAPQLHSAMRYAVPVRRDMGIRTIFNVLGPLTNPAGAKRQIVGVFDPALTKTIAEVLRDLGSEHALVVYGEGGIDELSTVGISFVSELKDGRVTSYNVNAEDLGIQKAAMTELRGGDSKHNAHLIKEILSGQPGPMRNIALLNAAGAIYVSGLACTLEEGFQMAATTVDNGSAAMKLQQWIFETNKRGDS
jgi:anthranilate phosphoribosyltransferase